jgi:hypothetical protein
MSSTEVEDNMTYILTKQSSPADANMPGFVGFQDIALTQPEI